MKIIGDTIVKTHEDITDKDSKKALLDAWTGTIWGWFATVEAELGTEKAIQFMRNLSYGFGKQMASDWLKYFNVEDMNVPSMSGVSDIVHALWGFKVPWTILSDNEGYETIQFCPIHNAAPPAYKKYCIHFCEPVFKNFYPGMSIKDCTAEMEKSKSRGDVDCLVRVKIIG